MGDPDTEGHNCPTCGKIEYCKLVVPTQGVYEYKCDACKTVWQEGS